LRCSRNFRRRIKDTRTDWRKRIKENIKFDTRGTSTQRPACAPVRPLRPLGQALPVLTGV